MRAGTLSDPRVVTLITKYFIPVHMTVLSTPHLLADADAALLKRLGARTFHGGEREAFLAPDGRLVDVFLSLHVGAEQFTRAGRADLDAAVDRFFRGAARAWRACRGELPADWADLRAGRVRSEAAAPSTAPSDHGGLRLRVAMRHDWMVYEDLSGWETVAFTPAEARRLVPADPGAALAWPRALFTRLARTFYPRGGGVHVEIAPPSVHGSLTATATEVTGAEIRGALRGAYRLAPRTERERGSRATYRPFLGAAGELRGDFVWDRAAGRFTSFRLAGVDATVRADHFARRSRDHACALGVELSAGRRE